MVYGPGRASPERARAALDRVGMSHRADHFPHELSGGEQQRVAIARALVLEPALLIADEPTGNLDAANGDQILDLVSGLNREGLTVLLVTHDPRVAARAQRIVSLADGRIVSDTALAAVSA
jgi:putative ABC transport system ATP-binding protein